MSFVQIWVAGFVLGAVNGAVGVLVTSGLLGLLRLIIPQIETKPLLPYGVNSDQEVLKPD